jgi:hypothetical protein
MNARLAALGRRRTDLMVQISQERAHLHSRMRAVQHDLAYVGMGLLLAQLFARRPWLRALALGGLAIAAGNQLKNRWRTAQDDWTGAGQGAPTKEPTTAALVQRTQHE